MSEVSTHIHDRCEAMRGALLKSQHGKDCPAILRGQQFWHPPSGCKCTCGRDAALSLAPADL